jgi:formate dehydrogenase beta subunit
VDVCPMNCYKMVPVEKIEGSSEVTDLIEARYAASMVTSRSRGAGGSQSRGTAMIKDDTQCIRCGLCQKRCPTGAITMEALSFEEQLVYSRDPE